MHIAVIGTSKIAHKLIQTFLSFTDIQLEAVYSRTLESGKRFADVYKCRKVYTNISEMLNDDTIDIIYIASPNALHVQHSEQCLYHRKHVFCEKPIAFSVSEMEKLTALAKQKECFFVEAMTIGFMPNYQCLRNDLNKRTPHLIICDLSQYSSRYELLRQGMLTNVFDPKMYGGALYDLGVYCLHFVVGLLGYPKQFQRYSVRYENGIDTSGVIIMNYEQCNAVLSYGKDSKGKAHARIQCEDGYYTVDGACSRMERVEFHHNGEIEVIGAEINENHHWYEVQAFLNMIREKNIELQYQLWKQSLTVCSLLESITKGEAL